MMMLWVLQQTIFFHELLRVASCMIDGQLTNDLGVQCLNPLYLCLGFLNLMIKLAEFLTIVGKQTFLTLPWDCD